MAEKRVNVRLAATGGRQVKSELRGVGEAGRKGFRRLSREVEAANKRLALIARRVKQVGLTIIAAKMAQAATGIIRSGLQIIDAQAKIAQSLDTTTASVQVLARAAELSGNTFTELEAGASRLTRRLSMFASDGSGPAATAIERLGLNAANLLKLPLDQRIARVTDAIRETASAAEQAALFSQFFGDRAFAAFQRLDTATLRAANADLEKFGVLVSDQDADRIEATNDAISRLGLLWRGLSNQLAIAAAPALQAAAEGLARLGAVGGPIQKVFRGVSTALVVLIDNLRRVMSTAAAFVGFFAGRFVARLALAALGVRGLATALVVLRGALIRTGIGALIVGAGELIYQFTQLAGKVGGIGNAFKLLWRVAKEAWNRIALSADAAWARVESGWASMQAVINDGLQASLEAVVGWANSAVGTFKGAFDAVKAIWGLLPGAIGDFALRAANGLITGVESMLNAVVTRINTFINGLNAALALLPDWATGDGGAKIGTLEKVNLGGIANPYAGAASEAGKAAAEAFRAAMGKTYINAPDLFGGMADDARGRASGYAEAARMLADAASRPMTAWQELRDAVTGTGEDSKDALSEAAEAAKAMATALKAAEEAGRNAGGGTANAADQATSAIDKTTAAAAALGNQAKTGFAKTSQVLADYAASAGDFAGQIGGVLVGAFKSAEGAFRKFVEGGKLSFKGLISSMVADLAVLAFRSMILSPIAKWLGGLFGGGGGLMASARGNVFSAGNVVPFASGGIVDRPTVFPMANGTGLMGEAGPEAIMPLKRIGGRLGVEATPAPGGGTVDVRLFVDRGGNWQAAVERISGRVSANTVAGAQIEERRALPERIDALRARGTT